MMVNDRFYKERIKNLEIELKESRDYNGMRIIEKSNFKSTINSAIDYLRIINAKIDGVVCKRLPKKKFWSLKKRRRNMIDLQEINGSKVIALLEKVESNELKLKARS